MWSSQPEWFRRSAAITGSLMAVWVLLGVMNGFSVPTMVYWMVRDLLTTPTGLIVLAVVVGGSVAVSKKSIAQRNKKEESQQRLAENPVLDGYKPPVEWSEAFVPSDGHPNAIRTPTGSGQGFRSLLTHEDRALRSRMSPFVVWYYGNDYANSMEIGKGWINVVDGNHRLAGVTPMPNYMQVKNVNLPDIGRRGMALFSITPDIANGLNQGPRRQAKIRGILYPEGKPLDLTLFVGLPGAQFPTAPVEPSGEFGTAKEMAERELRASGIMD